MPKQVPRVPQPRTKEQLALLRARGLQPFPPVMDRLRCARCGQRTFIVWADRVCCTRCHLHTRLEGPVPAGLALPLPLDGQLDSQITCKAPNCNRSRFFLHQDKLVCAFKHQQGTRETPVHPRLMASWSLELVEVPVRAFEPARNTARNQASRLRRQGK